MKRKLNILFSILIVLMLAVSFFGPNADSISPHVPIFVLLIWAMPALRRGQSSSAAFTDFVLEKRFGTHKEAVRWAGFGILLAGFFFQSLCPDFSLGTNVMLITLAFFFLHGLWLVLVIVDQKAIWREKWKQEPRDP